MSAWHVEIVIESLALEGFSPSEGESIREALIAELQRLFLEETLPEWAGAKSHERLVADAATLPVDQPAMAGRQAAMAVFDRIVKSH